MSILTTCRLPQQTCRAGIISRWLLMAIGGVATLVLTLLWLSGWLMGAYYRYRIGGLLERENRADTRSWIKDHYESVQPTLHDIAQEMTAESREVFGVMAEMRDGAMVHVAVESLERHDLDGGLLWSIIIYLGMIGDAPSRFGLLEAMCADDPELSGDAYEGFVLGNNLDAHGLAELVERFSRIKNEGTRTSIVSLVQGLPEPAKKFVTEPETAAQAAAWIRDNAKRIRWDAEAHTFIQGD